MANRSQGLRQRRLALRTVERIPSDSMNLTQLTSADLKQIVKLLEQRETLQSQVANIDAKLDAYDEGREAATSVKGKPGRKAGSRAQARPGKAKRAKRGAL